MIYGKLPPSRAQQPIASKPMMRPGLQPPQPQVGTGGGDINSALQSLRGLVGYSPANPAGGGGLPAASRALPAAGIGGVRGPMGQPFKPPEVLGGDAGQLGADIASPVDEMGLSDMEKAGKGDIVNNRAAVPTAVTGVYNGSVPTAPQPASMVGAGGGIQQLGSGRFGGNPPPNVLARRGGIFRGGGSGGIMDRRQLLNNRMRSRIQQFGGGPNGGPLGFDPTQVL